MVRPKLYLYQDKWVTLSDVSNATGIKKEKLKDRIKSGRTLEQAVEMGTENPCIRKYPRNGKMMTIREIAEELDIPYDRLRSRLNRGWTFEDAISTSIYGQKNPTESLKAGAEAILSESPPDEEMQCRAAINICRQIISGDPREVGFRCTIPMTEYRFESDILGYRIRFESGGRRARLTAWYRKHGFESGLSRTYAIEGDKPRELHPQQRFTGGMKR